jgi:hypothetical protein
MVMLRTFDDHLVRRLAVIDTTPEIRQTIYAERIRLAAMEIPAQVDPATTERIRQSIDESFIAAFRIVMWIAAGLALTSAVIAASLIRDN